MTRGCGMRRSSSTRPKSMNLCRRVVVMLGHSPVVEAAQGELIRGVRGMLGRTLREETSLPQEKAIVLGTLADVQEFAPGLKLTPKLRPDGYWLTTSARPWT